MAEPYIDPGYFYFGYYEGDPPEILHPLVAMQVKAHIPRRGRYDLEPGVWQMVAIPSRLGAWVSGVLERGTTAAKIKEYVIDQLESKYGVGCVTVANAYPGHENRFLSFVPGSTPPTSEHNFLLMYEEEDGTFEPTAFWLKSNHVDPMVLDFVEWR